ncbi:DEAD/DEAH box helicase [Ruania halotolerans]|uniref:DEAD/DEAH box helicase n=1 Tax=Ruania halotolerans TaxID=2897773 RepID=UPI001E53D643|nr:DEAD/DEAH box helicase [Ruania halotolerans]UFU07140.1 DEAD/DEAH box helicase [Ruania halotolerans]
MSDPDTLGVLLTPRRVRESLVHVEHIPPREGARGTWPDWADPELMGGYVSRGVAAPWEHQVEAAEAAWAGRHVVLATATGSGKSLASWLPAISAVRAATREGPGTSIAALNRRPTVLYLSPTKALAADQLHGLQSLLRDAAIRDVRPATCDGDTPSNERDWVRDYADLVLTNPDFLHFSLLPRHRRWQRFLRGLRFVVVDECHAYRGVLGAHVALVLRRLLRLAAHYGATPSAILASATTGDPGQSAARLLGVPAETVTAVTTDTATAGRRTVALWQPPVLDPAGAYEETAASADGTAPEAGIASAADASPADAASESNEWRPSGTPEDGPRRSTLAETSELLTDLVRAGRRTLAFVRSRVGAEAIADQTRSQLRDRGSADPHGAHGAAIDLPGTVAAYRGGYLPEERRELERALRTGELRALATTNALELGVDIAGLDAVLIAGWPGTRVSFWQQVGRAGRAGAEGLAVLIASDNPLDAYLVHHPDMIFGAPVEATAFDPGNPYVLAPHLCAAAAEQPLTEADLEIFGPGTSDLLAELVARGLLRRRSGGWYWNYSRPEDPAALTDLRGGGGAPVQVVEASTGRVLGTVDAARADATVHTGAVYVHQGRTFLVQDYSDDVALVTEKTVGYRTRSRSDKHITVLETQSEHQWGPVRWAYGTLEVTERVVGYDRRRLPGLELVGSYSLDLPEHTLRTTGCWWSVPAEVLDDAGLTQADLPGALHAAEHAAIGLLGLVATCDRWDIGGLSTALHQDTLEPTVFVYDGYPGGAGFAQRGYAMAGPWLTATRDAVAGCRCATGCPACIQSPKCGNNNSPLDKAGALAVLGLLFDLAPRV